MAPAGLIRAALSRQEVRFIIAGGSGAVLFFLLSFLIVSAGMPPFAGTSLAYLVCFLTVYTVHRYWTFSTDVPHGRAFPRYLLLQLFCASAAGWFAHFLVHTYGFQPLAMSALTTVASSVFSYFVTSLWVFAEK